MRQQRRGTIVTNSKSKTAGMRSVVSSTNMYFIRLRNVPLSYRTLLLAVGGIFGWVAYSMITNSSSSSSNAAAATMPNSIPYDTTSSLALERCNFDAYRVDEVFPGGGGCACPCAGTALPRYDTNARAWTDHHGVLEQAVGEWNSQPRDAVVNVIFIGDSITEHWNGTRSMGRVPMKETSAAASDIGPKEYRASFDTYFGRDSTTTTSDGATVQFHGLLLGSSGDICNELLFHLQNGMMPKPTAANTTVFVLLIGTNDLGRFKCTSTTVVESIVSIAEYVTAAAATDESVRLLIHGLLPRDDTDCGHTATATKYTLGKYWATIKTINQQLKSIIDEKKKNGWYYTDSSDLFLSNATAINESLLNDGLHPTVKGYRLWGQHLVDTIHQIL